MKLSRMPSGLGLISLALLAASPASATDRDRTWSYRGGDGPAHWGELAADYEACGKGSMQSPIDLARANVAAVVTADIAYKPLPLTVLNNGHTVQFNVDNGSSIEAHGTRYALLQIHFHTPSEHVVDGVPYPLEAHFVHRAEDGTLAVIGVFLDQGAENAALAGLVAHLPELGAEAATFDDVTVDPGAILPGEPAFYRYMGSLTTPPCSENVNWFVVEQVAEASAEQIRALNEAMGDNARPPQPINNRMVIEPQ